MRGVVVLLLILGFPVLEAWLLFELGERIGWWVLAWLIVAGIAGILLIRLERLVWALRVAGSLSRNRSPIFALLASARTVFAGLLLIFPGVVSDVLALVLLLWPLPGGGAPPGGPGDDVIEGEYRRESGADRLPRRDR